MPLLVELDADDEDTWTSTPKLCQECLVDALHFLLQKQNREETRKRNG
jgi:hypothetical protein